MRQSLSQSFRLLVGLSLVVSVLGVTPLLAEDGAAAETPFGRLHPKAPPETTQFSFLLGEWKCTTRWMGQDGSLSDGPEATWTGSYYLDGWAIQDLWAAPAPDGVVYKGVNIRSFNPETKKWDNRWLPQGTLQWKYYSSEMVGDTMVMTGGEGTDAQGREFVDRNTFYDIQEDSWKWRKDRSFDGGETWIEGVGHIHAKRAS